MRCLPWQPPQEMGGGAITLHSATPLATPADPGTDSTGAPFLGNNPGDFPRAAQPSRTHMPSKRVHELETDPPCWGSLHKEFEEAYKVKAKVRIVESGDVEKANVKVRSSVTTHYPPLINDTPVAILEDSAF